MQRDLPTARSPRSSFRIVLRVATIIVVAMATWRLVTVMSARAVAPSAHRDSDSFDGPAANSTESPLAIASRLRASLGLMSEVEGPAHGRMLRPAFEDITASVGLDFVHDNDANGLFTLPEQLGPGAAFIDYDNDGDMDIFITGGGSIIGDGPTQACVLYRNDGDRFANATIEANVNVNGPAYGVACADIDADGFTDIFITRLNGNVLLRNRGDGTFEDITTSAGIRSEGFGAGAAFFDYDMDGLLDVYVCRYVDWRADREQQCFSTTGIRDYCSPNAYSAPTTDRLFRNIGGGRFADVSAAAGIEASQGNGLGVVAHDFDGDGWEDLYVANDATRAFLWHNRGDGTFEDVAEIRGCAFDGQGIAISGMGVACEDFNHDGQFDVLVTNIRNQSNLVLENVGGFFTDSSPAFGVPAWSMPWTSFGIAMFDQDHDGELDALVANGAVNTTPATAQLPDPYAEDVQFLRVQGGRFVDATREIGLEVNCVGRAMVMGDIDNDGDIDALLTSSGGRAWLLRNTLNHDAMDFAWLMLDVRMENGNSAAIGATVEVTAGDAKWHRVVRPHSSYLSSHDPRVHVGLGKHETVDHVVIRWTDGRSLTLNDVAARQHLTVRPPSLTPSSEGSTP